MQFRGVLAPVLDSHVQYLPRGCQEFQSLLPKQTSSHSGELGVGEVFFLFFFLLDTVSSPLPPPQWGVCAWQLCVQHLTVDCGNKDATSPYARVTF